MSEEYTVATEEELEYERALAMLKADRDAWEADCLALQAQNRDLLAALERMTPDYEHCAPDEEGNIEPDRIALIKQARAAIAAARSDA
ncbi:MAG TPA: hypothetical protein VJA25_07905 [Dehalococcoidia bacterium]|nr:hypothetical protein [Dehalococcoidia bacterium]